MRSTFIAASLLLCSSALSQLSPEEARQRMADLNRRAATAPVAPVVEKFPEPNFMRLWRVRDGAPDYIRQWIADQPQLRSKHIAEIDDAVSDARKLLDDATREQNHLIVGQPKTNVVTDAIGAGHQVYDADDVADRNDRRHKLNEIIPNIRKFLVDMLAEKQNTQKDQIYVVVPKLSLAVGSFGYIHERVKVVHVAPGKTWVVGKLDQGDKDPIYLSIGTDASKMVDGMEIDLDGTPYGIFGTRSTVWGTVLSLEEVDWQKWVYQITVDRTPGHLPTSQPSSGPMKLSKPIRRYTI